MRFKSNKYYLDIVVVLFIYFIYNLCVISILFYIFCFSNKQNLKEESDVKLEKKKCVF